jgi:hypothetical protein
MMAHWAEIDENNVVTRVLVGDNEDPNGDEGYQWLIDNLGGTWIQTSYNGNIRKNFAGVGYTYNSTLDAFIPPKPDDCEELNEETCTWIPPQPFASWTFSTSEGVWKSPVAYPTFDPEDPKYYRWDESTLSWIERAP